MASGRLLLLIPFIWVAAAPRADAQVLRGAVIDATTRARVAAAAIELVDAVQGDRTRTETDSTGLFMVRLPRAGTYRMSVSHISYVMYEVTDLELGTGEIVTLEIRLGQDAVPLEPLLVTARRAGLLQGVDERRRSGFGQYLTREQIDARNAARVSDLMRDVSGIILRRAGPSGSLILVRGGGTGACMPAIWLDGVEIQQRPGSTLDDILTPNVIEAVEVYTALGGAPTQYVSGTCGVILFWTRQGSGEDGEPWQWKKFLIGAGATIGLILLIFR